MSEQHLKASDENAFDESGKQSDVQTGAAAQGPVSIGHAFWTWLKIGLLSFGGPAGQIAIMHRILVEEKRWLDERTYMLALNFCSLLPGPEAMQLATYSGWRLHGVRGGLMAGGLFVLPGAIVVLVLALLYVMHGTVPAVETLFLGIKAAVVGIVFEALFRLSRRALNSNLAFGIAVAAFIAIFFLKIPFPLIVIGAAVIGFYFGCEDEAQRATDAGNPTAAVRVSWRETLATVAIWLAIWILPLLGIAWWFGGNSVFAEIGSFFSILAVVSFGGAYALLAYMAQQAVETHGWLQAGEMLDGLGLAETTPGPLILVTEFVGTLAGYRHHGTQMSDLGAGIIGAVVTLWAMFAPCFLFIFAGAPYIERLQNTPRLRSALSAITSAIVGIIANLGVWFAMNVLFLEIGERTFGPLHIMTPDIASFDAAAGALIVLGLALLVLVRLGVVTTMVLCAVAAFVLQFIQ